MPIRATVVAPAARQPVSVAHQAIIDRYVAIGVDLQRLNHEAFQVDSKLATTGMQAWLAITSGVMEFYPRVRVSWGVDVAGSWSSQLATLRRPPRAVTR